MIKENKQVAETPIQLANKLVIRDGINNVSTSHKLRKVSPTGPEGSKLSTLRAHRFLEKGQEEGEGEGRLLKGSLCRVERQDECYEQHNHPTDRDGYQGLMMRSYVDYGYSIDNATAALYGFQAEILISD